MNPQIKKLSKEAGFVFWGHDAHGPGPGHIDWSCDYEQEFEKFTEALIRKCAKISSSKAFGAFQAEEAVLAHFDLKPNRSHSCSLLTPIKEDKYGDTPSTPKSYRNQTA